MHSQQGPRALGVVFTFLPTPLTDMGVVVVIPKSMTYLGVPILRYPSPDRVTDPFVFTGAVVGVLVTRSCSVNERGSKRRQQPQPFTGNPYKRPLVT